LNKIVSKKRTSSIFLAIVLVAGISALSFPSFMTGAQAESDYEMDDYKKSYGKDVSVKKIDCSNVNVNVNGFELNVLPPTIEELATSQELSVDEGKESNSIESDLSDGDGDRQSDSDTNNRIVCISNNNNINVGEESPEPLTCEECFNEFLTGSEIIALKDVFFEAERTLEQLCNHIGTLSEANFRSALEIALGNEQDERIDNLLECLLKAGIEFQQQNGL
jgi:hypothetical protein